MIKILVIEDEKKIRENLVELLLEEKFTVLEAENGAIGVELARLERPDLILCDVMMPELDGYGVLEKLRSDYPEIGTIPFIFLTAKGDRKDLRQGMSLGADDYLTKPCSQDELLGAIETRLQKQEDRVAPYTRALKRAASQLNHLVNYDPITNLPNRLLLRERFNQILRTQRSKNADQSGVVPVLVLGLDRFDRIEENLGYSSGEELLKAVAKRLSNSLTAGDTVAHLDKDRFVIILGKSCQKQHAFAVAKMMLDRCREPLSIEGQEVFLTASIGIGFYPRDGQDLEKILQGALGGMKTAQQQGGNKYQCYTAALKRDDLLGTEASLHYALEREELEVWYQPQVSLKDGKIVGAEALLRWQHPEQGLVSPAKFIPIAEETGLIVPIGQWVLQTACQQAKIWQAMGYADLRIAVNLSARQFQQPDMRRNLVDICLSTGLDPKYLELELTESTVVQNPEVAIATLQALKTLGVQLALDDFGTGYSSLSYLQKFPFDILKIDREFIHKSTVNKKNQALTTAIIQMAHNLDLKVIAEGVEREAERKFLCQQHCDEMQGYLFSRALTAKGFQQLLFS